MITFWIIKSLLSVFVLLISRNNLKYFTIITKSPTYITKFRKGDFFFLRNYEIFRNKSEIRDSKMILNKRFSGLIPINRVMILANYLNNRQDMFNIHPKFLLIPNQCYFIRPKAF